jgi:hypothetical protein
MCCLWWQNVRLWCVLLLWLVCGDWVCTDLPGYVAIGDVFCHQEHHYTTTTIYRRFHRLYSKVLSTTGYSNVHMFNPLTPELNPSAQRSLTRYFTGEFTSWTVNFVNICLKYQQIQQLFIQFINCVWCLLHVSALHCHPQGVFLVPSERWNAPRH